MRAFIALSAVTLVVAVLAAQTVTAPRPPSQDELAFEGTWSGSGQRQVLPTENQPAATVQLSGTVSLTSTAGLSRGFRGEVLGFDDGAGLIAGRAVWTDERGDRIFSVLKGEALASGRQWHGIITGGTGRYAGLTGSYELRWQYLLSGEGTQLSGRSVDLRGRVRARGGQ